MKIMHDRTAEKQIFTVSDVMEDSTEEARASMDLSF